MVVPTCMEGFIQFNTHRCYGPRLYALLMANFEHIGGQTPVFGDEG